MIKKSPILFLLAIFLLSACGLAQPTAMPTPTIAPTSTPTVTPLPTSTPTLTPTLTPSPTAIPTLTVCSPLYPEICFTGPILDREQIEALLSEKCLREAVADEGAIWEFMKRQSKNYPKPSPFGDRGGLISGYVVYGVKMDDGKFCILEAMHGPSFAGYWLQFFEVNPGEFELFFLEGGEPFRINE